MDSDQLLARNLLSALTAGQVQPFFQPIVSLDDGRVLGFEVLARWLDPAEGYISPDRFIPVADRFGLLDRLLDQLMRTSFLAAADWPHNLFLGSLSGIQRLAHAAAQRRAGQQDRQGGNGFVISLEPRAH